MSKAPSYTIGEMAEQFNLTLRTLRFYEMRGLLSPTRHGVTRIYSEDDRRKLTDIVRWRSQGFTVSEMKDGLVNGGFARTKIVDQIAHLRQQRNELDTAIAELMRLVERASSAPSVTEASPEPMTGRRRTQSA